MLCGCAFSVMSSVDETSEAFPSNRGSIIRLVSSVPSELELVMLILGS